MLHNFDITKPPPSPPNRIKSGWGSGCIETADSQQNQADYLKNLNKYGKDLAGFIHKWHGHHTNLNRTY